MKSFGEYRRELAEAKATYCGRCGPAELQQKAINRELKKRGVMEGTDLSEAAPGENLPGKATHLTNKDIRHPEHGIIPGSTTLRHLGADSYEVRAGKAKGKTIRLGGEHVQKLSEEVKLDEEIKKGDFVKDPQGKIHRVFDVKGNMLHTGEYRGKNTYGGTSMLHKTKAAKVAKPADIAEEVEQIDEVSYKTLQSYRQQAHTQIQHHKFGGGKDKPEAGEIIAKREKGMASATAKVIAKDKAKQVPAAPQKIEPYKPLGGRDEKSGRSYSEEVELDEAVGQHKVTVTVSDPNHPAVSQRKETVMKRVIVNADNKDHAVVKAKEFYKKKGYKVHDAEYHSPQPKSTMKTEEAEQIDELKSSTLKSYADKRMASFDRTKGIMPGSKEHEQWKKAQKAYDQAAAKTVVRTQAREEAEQVDELNQMTLSRYAAKARSDMMKQAHVAGSPESSVKDAGTASDKLKKRQQGMKTANRKLRFGEYSEMVDQQNEKQ